jgi:hypothetical protein
MAPPRPPARPSSGGSWRESDPSGRASSISRTPLITCPTSLAGCWSSPPTRRPTGRSGTCRRLSHSPRSSSSTSSRTRREGERLPRPLFWDRRCSRSPGSSLRCSARCGRPPTSSARRSSSTHPSSRPRSVTSSQRRTGRRSRRPWRGTSPADWHTSQPESSTATACRG